MSSGNGSTRLEDRINELESRVYQFNQTATEIACKIDDQTRVLRDIYDKLEDVPKLRTDVEVLKTRTGWFGMLGGLIAFVGMAIIEFFKH